VNALRDAANDDALRGAPLTVYVWLITNHLDTQEPRPVKVSGLARTMRVRRQTVTRALRVLCLRGYLERRNTARGPLYRAYSVRCSPLVSQSAHTHTAA
jgi:DNA-binding MarR family transcriptional regulator